MHKEYKDLIKKTLFFISQKKEEHIFLKDEEYIFFKKELDSLAPKKRIKKDIPIPQKTTILKIPKKIPITFKEEKPIKKITKKNPTLKKEEFLFLEKPTPFSKNLNDIKTIIKALDHKIKINETPYSDAKAKNISQSWKMQKKAQIAILSFKESPQGILFLKNLKKALEIYFYKTEIFSSLELEKKDKWPLFFKDSPLKLIIACDYSIFNFKKLIKYYKEIPLQKKHFLSNIPLFMLADISIYLKNPLLKRSLWESLSKLVKKL